MTMQLSMLTAASIGLAARTTGQLVAQGAMVKAKLAVVDRQAIGDIEAFDAPGARLKASDFCEPRQGGADDERAYRGILGAVPDVFDDVEEYVARANPVAVRFLLRVSQGEHLFAALLTNFFTVRNGLIAADEGIFGNGSRSCTPSAGVHAEKGP
jgi:hypothetical protein